MNKLSYTQRLKELNLYSLELRRPRGDMIETNKILTNIYDPITTKTLMQVDTKTKTWTHTFKIHKERFNTNKYNTFSLTESSTIGITSQST